ncbi:MAG: beta-lactamase family protein, partial [Actinomycetota bacterium]|nr:beta-lactamase family protein [Actinomycetota bacterium]
MPAVPRLPFVPDLLNRVHVPRDLDSVTTIGEEASGGGSIGTEGVEKIWKAAVAMYRSGVHPAVQVCVRREGEVVLDRAIGHARGNGPDDTKETPKVAATPGTPMTVYSAAKGVTAFVAHKLVEKGLLALDDPVAAYVPGYDKHNKGSIT